MAALELGTYVSYQGAAHMAVKSTGGTNAMVTIIHPSHNTKLCVSRKKLTVMPYKAAVSILPCGKRTLLTLKGHRLSLVSYRWLKS